MFNKSNVWVNNLSYKTNIIKEPDAKENILIKLLVLAITGGYSQENFLKTIRIDANLELLFPSESNVLDILSNIYRSGNHGFYYYQVVTSKSALKINNFRKFKIALNGVVDGYLSSEQLTHFRSTVIDTSIGGTIGKLIISIGKNADLGYQKMYSYISLARNQVYIVKLLSNDKNETSENKMCKTFYSSLKFSPTAIPDYVKDEKLRKESYSFGQKLGKYLGLVLLVLISILAILYFVRRKYSSPAPGNK